MCYLDPDPNSLKKLYPYPHKANADPKHWLQIKPPLSKNNSPEVPFLAEVTTSVPECHVNGI
jgi:hypothetical protein